MILDIKLKSTIGLLALLPQEDVFFIKAPVRMTVDFSVSSDLMDYSVSDSCRGMIVNFWNFCHLMLSPIQRCQLLETKCGWNVNSTLTSWGFAWSKVKSLVSLRYLDPSTYTVKSYLGNKFTTAAKKFFSINQPTNLLHMLQLLALTRPSSFQLD